MLMHIIFIYTLNNIGDEGHAKAVIRQLTMMQPSLHITEIKTPSDKMSLLKGYHLAMNAINPEDSILLYAIGDEGVQHLKTLQAEGLLTANIKHITLVSHQYSSLIESFIVQDKFPLDFIALNEPTVDTFAKKEVVKKVPSSALMFAVPTTNPTATELKASYDNWTVPSKPSLDKDYIVVMLPGDAPDQQKKMHYFTEDSAIQLFKNLQALWQQQGKKHTILLQNGPRTGKHDAKTGDVVCPHEYQQGSDPKVAIDKISQFFVNLLHEHQIPYEFYNFAFELNTTSQQNNSVSKKTISHFNPLLYIAQSATQNNYFIVPGESVSMLGQIPLYLPANKVIVFKPSSMSEGHMQQFNAALEKKFVSYFDEKGEVVVPPAPITKRDSDDAHLVAEGLLQSYNKKIAPAKSY